MATTVTRPNYWTITTTSNTTPVFDFKFVVDIYIDGVKKARLKQPKNGGDAAHFDFERIVKNYIKPTYEHSNTITGTDYKSIHIMPQNVVSPSAGVYNDFLISGGNTDTIKYVTFKFFEEYSTTDGGAVSITSSASDVIYAIINYADEWEDMKIFESELYDMDDTLAVAGSKFLTKLPILASGNNHADGYLPHITGEGDYRTLAWLNEDADYFNTQRFRLDIKFFENTPQYLFFLTVAPGTYRAKITIPAWSSDYGGSNPSAVTTDNKALLFCGAGFENINGLYYPDFGSGTLTSSDVYYTIQAVSEFPTFDLILSDVSNIRQGDYVKIETVGTTDFTLIGSPNNTIGTEFYATGAATGTGSVRFGWFAPLCSPYTFEIKRSDKTNSNKYSGQTIAWKNKFGAWDYHYFDNVFKESVATKRSVKYENNAGTWNAATYSINSYDKGKVQDVTGAKSLTVNTRYLDENYNDYFKGMLQSNEILLIQPIETGDDDITQVSVPLMLKTSSLDYKTSVNNKLVQYTFSFEYAHELKKYV